MRWRWGRARFWAVPLVAVATASVCAAPAIGLLLLPGFALALLLLLGWYPGEETLVRLAGRRRIPRRADHRVLPRAPRSLGRRLAPLASFGASRAPPVAA